MANKTIPDLETASSVDASDWVPVDTGIETKKASVQTITDKASELLATTFTPFDSYGTTVADITALKGVGASERADGQTRLVEDIDVFYGFDAASTATGDDDLVVQPTSGSGRWIKKNFAGDGTANALQVDTSGIISTLVAGENISARDAVCLDLSSGVYKVYKANTTVGTRKNSFFGFATAAATSGNTVSVRWHGFLAGFSSLSVTSSYYLGNSAGAITNTPTDPNPFFVAQAIDASTIFIPARAQIFPTGLSMYSAMGTTTGLNASGGLTSMDAFDFSTWAASTAAPAARSYGTGSEGSFNGKFYWVDGRDTGGTVTGTTYSWDKSSWATLSARTTAKIYSAATSFAGKLVVCKGSTTASASTGVDKVDTYDGSSWTSSAATLTVASQLAAFTHGGQIHAVGGVDGSSTGVNQHDTWNGTSTGTSTVYPASVSIVVGCNQGSNGLMGGSAGSTTTSYLWNGTTWSASMTMSYVVNAQGTASGGFGSSSGSNSNNQKGYVANGNASSTNVTNASASNNGTSWSSEGNTTVSRSACAGGCI